MRFLTAKQAQLKLQMSNGTFYNKLNPKSRYYDATFPRGRRIGRRAVRWLESELDAWINSLAIALTGGLPCATN